VSHPTEPDPAAGASGPGPEPAAIARARGLTVLDTAALGDRVVVRAHDAEDGARDALGDLVARDGTSVTIATRRGPVAVRLADVIAAKPVPPPPPRRH
jgi:hypothetical protein